MVPFALVVDAEPGLRLPFGTICMILRGRVGGGGNWWSALLIVRLFESRMHEKLHSESPRISIGDLEAAGGTIANASRSITGQLRQRSLR